MTIEIHNPELESILDRRLKAGNFASVEDLLLETFRDAQCPGADEDRKVKALEATARIRELRLTAYDTAYLDLAKRLALPLATLDGHLQIAALAEGVETL